MKSLVILFMCLLLLLRQKDFLVTAETTTSVTLTDSTVTTSTTADDTTSDVITESEIESTTAPFTVIETTKGENSTSETTTSSTDVDTTLETTSNGFTTSSTQSTTIPDGLNDTNTDESTTVSDSTESTIETSTDTNAETSTSQDSTTTSEDSTSATSSTDITTDVSVTSSVFTSDVTNNISTSLAPTTDVTHNVSTSFTFTATTMATSDLPTNEFSTTDSFVTSTSANNLSSGRSTIDFGTTFSSSESPLISSSHDPSTTGFLEVSTTPYMSTTESTLTETDDYLGVIIALSVILGMLIIIFICFCVYVGLKCERKHKNTEKDDDSIGDFSNKSFDIKPPKSDTKPPKSDTKPPKSDTKPPKSGIKTQKSDNFFIEHEEKIDKNGKISLRPTLDTKFCQTDDFLLGKQPADEDFMKREVNTNTNHKTSLIPKMDNQFCQTDDLVLISVKCQTDDERDPKLRLRIKTHVFELSASPEVVKPFPVASGTQTDHVVILDAGKSERHSERALFKGDNFAPRSKIDAECQTEEVDFNSDKDIVVLKQEPVFNANVDNEHDPDSEMYWFEDSTESTWTPYQLKVDDVPQKHGGESSSEIFIIEDNSTSLDYEISTETNVEQTTRTYSELIEEIEDMKPFETIHKLFEKHEMKRRIDRDHDALLTRSCKPVRKGPVSLKYRPSSVSPIPTKPRQSQKMTKRRYKNIYKNILETLLKPGKSNKDIDKQNKSNEMEEMPGVRTNGQLFDTRQRSNINTRYAKRRQLRRIAPYS